MEHRTIAASSIRSPILSLGRIEAKERPTSENWNWTVFLVFSFPGNLVLSPVIASRFIWATRRAIVFLGIKLYSIMRGRCLHQMSNALNQCRNMYILSLLFKNHPNCYAANRSNNSCPSPNAQTRKMIFCIFVHNSISLLFTIIGRWPCRKWTCEFVVGGSNLLHFDIIVAFCRIK